MNLVPERCISMSAERGAGYSWSCGFASLSTSLKLFHARGSADDASLRCTQVAGTMSCNAGAGIQLLGRYVYLLLQCVRLQAQLLTVCRPCTSLWWNEVLRRGLCLASLQGLQHLQPVRHASGKVDASDLLLSDCERFPKASFCVTAEFPRLYRT